MVSSCYSAPVVSVEVWADLLAVAHLFLATTGLRPCTTGASGRSFGPPPPCTVVLIICRYASSCLLFNANSNAMFLPECKGGCYDSFIGIADIGTFLSWPGVEAYKLYFLIHCRRCSSPRLPEHSALALWGMMVAFSVEMRCPILEIFALLGPLFSSIISHACPPS